MDKIERLLNRNKIKPKQTPIIIEITREDFDLLDVEENVTYHIAEEDGTVTIRKGVNR